MLNRIEEIKNYRRLVLAANKESIKKEAFKDLLNRLFARHAETKRIVDVITSGAEKPILNIPRKDKLYRGSAGLCSAFRVAFYSLKNQNHLR